MTCICVMLGKDRCSVLESFKWSTSTWVNEPSPACQVTTTDEDDYNWHCYDQNAHLFYDATKLKPIRLMASAQKKEIEVK